MRPPPPSLRQRDIGKHEHLACLVPLFCEDEALTNELTVLNSLASVSLPVTRMESHIWREKHLQLDFVPTTHLSRVLESKLGTSLAKSVCRGGFLSEAGAVD